MLPFALGIFIWGMLLRMALTSSDLQHGLVWFWAGLATIHLAIAAGQAYRVGVSQTTSDSQRQNLGA